MNKLYLDILKIGQEKGKLTLDELQNSLVLKGYNWDVISSPAKKIFDDNFDNIDSKYFMLKSVSISWLLEYKSNQMRNIGIFILAILFSIFWYLTFKKPQVTPRMQINGFKN